RLHLSSWLQRPPLYTLFPYTTLFRSHLARGLAKVRSLRQQVGSSEIGEEARYEADFILAQKERQFQEALRHAHQLKMQVIAADGDRKSTRLNSSHVKISYAVFCLKKK